MDKNKLPLIGLH